MGLLLVRNRLRTDAFLFQWGRGICVSAFVVEFVRSVLFIHPSASHTRTFPFIALARIRVGLSAGLLLLVSGDILGASGLVSSSLLTPRKTLTDPSLTWKLVFLSTFLLFSNVILGQHFTNDTRLGNDPSIPVVSIYGYLLGGLFVGFGTR